MGLFFFPLKHEFLTALLNLLEASCYFFLLQPMLN